MLANKVINNGSNIIYGFDAFSLNKNRFSEDKILNRYKTFKKEIESQIKEKKAHILKSILR